MNRRWQVALVVVVVAVPVGVLSAVTLMNSGLSELAPILVEPVSWHMYRPKLDPDHSFSINQTIQNSYSNNGSSVDMSVCIMHYLEDWSSLPLEYRDGITFNVNVTADSTLGPIESVLLKCYVLDANASVEISTVEALKEYNVKVTRTRYFGSYSSAAYIEAQALESPCSLFTDADWIFNDQNTEEHALNVTSEVHYYNGTTIQKVVVPIILDMPVSTQAEGEP